MLCIRCLLVGFALMFNLTTAAVAAEISPGFDESATFDQGFALGSLPLIRALTHTVSAHQVQPGTGAWLARAQWREQLAREISQALIRAQLLHSEGFDLDLAVLERLSAQVGVISVSNQNGGLAPARSRAAIEALVSHQNDEWFHLPQLFIHWQAEVQNKSQSPFLEGLFSALIPAVTYLSERIEAPTVEDGQRQNMLLHFNRVTAAEDLVEGFQRAIPSMIGQKLRKKLSLVVGDIHSAAEKMKRPPFQGDDLLVAVVKGLEKELDHTVGYPIRCESLFEAYVPRKLMN